MLDSEYLLNRLHELKMKYQRERNSGAKDEFDEGWIVCLGNVIDDLDKVQTDIRKMRDNSLYNLR